MSMLYRNHRRGRKEEFAEHQKPNRIEFVLTGITQL